MYLKKGRLTASDGQKGSHFLQLCGARNIPVIFLQNNSGQENESLDYHSAEEIKETAKFAHSCANLNVPKIALNIGGLGGPQDLAAMCGPSFGARFYLSWPRARYSKHELTKIVEEEENQGNIELKVYGFVLTQSFLMWIKCYQIKVNLAVLNSFW